MKRLVLLVLSIFVVSQVTFASFRAYVTQPAPTNVPVAHELIHNPVNPPDDADEIVQTLGDKAFKYWTEATAINLLTTLLVLATSSQTLMYILLAISIPFTFYASLFTSLTIAKFIHSDSTNYKAVVKATIFPIIVYSLIILLYSIASAA